jgi:hypothetical protein
MGESKLRGEGYFSQAYQKGNLQPGRGPGMPQVPAIERSYLLKDFTATASSSLTSNTV